MGEHVEPWGRPGGGGGRAGRGGHPSCHVGGGSSCGGRDFSLSSSAAVQMATGRAECPSQVNICFAAPPKALQLVLTLTLGFSCPTWLGPGEKSSVVAWVAVYWFQPHSNLMPYSTDGETEAQSSRSTWNK